MKPTNSDYTPTLADAVRALIERRLVDLHTSLPGKIVSYDPTKQTADVQPAIQRLYEDGTAVNIPVLPKVPVVWPRANGGKVRLSMPLSAGDDVLIVFSERSLDQWKANGTVVNPKNRRKFTLSDAFCIPGGSAPVNAFTPAATDALEVANDQSQALLYADGKIQLKGGNSDELVKFLSDLIASLQRVYVITIFGNQPLIDPNDAGFVSLKTRIDSFKKG